MSLFIPFYAVYLWVQKRTNLTVSPFYTRLMTV